MIVKMEFPGSVIKKFHIGKSVGHSLRLTSLSLENSLYQLILIEMTGTPPRVKWVSWEIGRDSQYVRKKYIS